MLNTDQHPATRRLTLFLPAKLHQLIEEAAAKHYCRPAEFAKRQLVEALRRKQDDADAE
jgi:hypothetical protein